MFVRFQLKRSKKIPVIDRFYDAVNESYVVCIDPYSLWRFVKTAIFVLKHASMPFKISSKRLQIFQRKKLSMYRTPIYIIDHVKKFGIKCAFLLTQAVSVLGQVHAPCNWIVRFFWSENNWIPGIPSTKKKNVIYSNFFNVFLLAGQKI